MQLESPSLPIVTSCWDPTTFTVPGFLPSFCVASWDPSTSLVPEAFLHLEMTMQQSMLVATLSRKLLPFLSLFSLPTRVHSLQCQLLPNPRLFTTKDPNGNKPSSQDFFRASDIFEWNQDTKELSYPCLLFASEELLWEATVQSAMNNSCRIWYPRNFRVKY